MFLHTVCMQNITGTTKYDTVGLTEVVY